MSTVLFRVGAYTSLSTYVVLEHPLLPVAFPYTPFKFLTLKTFFTLEDSTPGLSLKAGMQLTYP